MTEYDTAHRLFDRVVVGDLREQAVLDLRRYFKYFSGRRFERFDGGGDRPDVADSFTSADVVAVMMLSIRWTATPALQLLETRSQELNDLLAGVPHTPMHQTDLADYQSGSPAHCLRRALLTIDGIGWVTASKLLARKRPHHVPVYDRVVAGLLDSPGSSWHCFHSWLAGDPAHAERLSSLRAEVGCIEDVSLLRCLDVALWMHGTQSGSQVPEPEEVQA
jgi:hypothetical protein